MKHPDHELDPFEETLRRRLGPASLESPPPALRALLLARVAELPPQPERFRLSAALLSRATGLGLVGLALGWLLIWLGRLLGSLVLVWHVPAGLLGGGGWLEVLRSPLALAVLPMLLLPLLYFLQDEGSQG